jgi:glutathione S-transferase
VAARDGAARYYREMEDVLGDGREWLAGAYSFADIAFYMAQLFGARKGAPMSDETPQLLAWRARMTARPAVARWRARWGATFLPSGGRCRNF